MSFEWKINSIEVDWNELSNLYRIAPLGTKAPEELKASFTNSMFKVFVYKSNTLLGAGRALADGFDCSYLCDIAVHPKFQGEGLGKQIVQKLIDLSKGHKKIILYSVPGKEEFYKKFGFQKMLTAMALFSDETEAVKNGYIARQRKQEAPELSLRQLGPDDNVQVVHALLKSAYTELRERSGVAYWASYQDLETTKLRVAKGECFLASRERTLVGTVTLYRKSESVGTPWFEKPGVTSFGLFAVDPRFQGHGIGRTLIRAIEDRAREWGMTELALDTSELLPTSIKMYQSLGYRFIEHVQWPQDTFRSVVLSKSLRAA